jgi:cytoskeletal protein CcmA (bactofilin family)
VNYFANPKSVAKAAEKTDMRFEPPLPAASSAETVSVFGPGMMISGNIVCAGGLQVFGRVTGEIHAARLTVCEGARVEGKIVAQDTVIQGEFKGTIHGNSVKLQGTALVDGEIYNRSLTIEQNAQFEGVARRLDRPVEAPSAERIEAEVPSRAALAPETLA